MKKPRDHSAAGKPGGRPAPPDLDGLELAARRSQRLTTAARLADGRTPLHVVEIAAGAAALMDQETQTVVARRPPRPPLACREGCAWCCHRTVGTAVPEVLRIVRFLRENLAPEEFLAMQERVVRLDEQRRALGVHNAAAGRLPCPLLVRDRCSVYPVRPLTCRGFTSSDARACERRLQSGERVMVPIYEPQQRLAAFVLDGLRAGLTEAGLHGERLELVAALRVALTRPDAAERWLAGDPVFAPARFLGE